MMEKLILNFSIKSIADFFKSKISSFSPNSENLDYIIDDNHFANFSDLQKIGEVEFKNAEDLLVFACKYNGELSERSSKKRQFEIAKKVLKEDFKDGAIFIFYDKNNCFRFSFIRKNYGNKEQKYSSWKRYTYFVDPNQTNKTFKNRIEGCNFSSLDDIQEAFSVEKLNRKFYQEIASSFYSLIGGKVNINKKEVSYEACLKLPSTPVENRKVYQEFAVRLIGRTIFCWFLKNKKSDNGVPLIPQDWLSSNRVVGINNEQHNYYHSILEKLFFLVLNKKQEDRKPYVLPEQQETVPFLNGGLFEAQDDDFFPKDSKGIHNPNFALDIPNQWFIDFYTVLEQYNFTIDENSINDFEVSIDPEMLGTIFENLLAEIDPDTEKSARKSTGSFYTPREIVDYMVEQSLLQYIKTKTGIEDEEQLELLLKDDTENTFDNKQTTAILEALSEVKILDPACGSGAFPMGVLHKIIVLLKKLDKGAAWWRAKQLDKIDNALVRKVMEEKLSKANSDYIRKLGVIQHSIYGVDIQPIAAEISKLRSFLSLIIDENINDVADNRGIEPLPNLEFKFVTANTLVGLESKKQQISFDFGETDELQNQLQKIRNSYLQASPTEKQKLKLDFEKLQSQIYENEIKAGGQNKRAQQLSAWKPFSNDSSSWFDSEWMFGVDKFDIVIGNPPYVSIKNQSIETREVLKKYKYSSGGDIYVAFVEVAFESFLKLKGNLVYIIPNKFFGANYGVRIRKFLRENTTINEIFDLKDEKVFESAQISTIVFNVSLIKNENSKYRIRKRDCVIILDNIFDSDDKIQIEQTDESSMIINKLNKFSKLSDFGVVRTGIMGFDYWKMEDIILNNRNSNNSLKIYTNGNINQYVDNWDKEITLYKSKYIKPRILLNPEYINQNTINFFKKTPKVIIRGVAKKLTSFVDYDGAALLVAVHGFVSETINPEIVTCVLNSNLINWYHLQTFYSQRIPQGSLKYPINFIEAIPFSVSKEFFLKIEELYKVIYKKLNDNMDCTCEKKILDIVVYRLYELTYEEVLIVDPDFELTQNEYETFMISDDKSSNMSIKK
jgi:adenine-specific DNA-methyltransferase